MKYKLAVPFAVVLVSLLSCTNHDRFPALRGAYLGQEPPGEEPQLFAPGVISTGLYERDVAISPEGDELYYGLALGPLVTIMVTRREDGRWTEPEVASFAADPDYFYFEPCLSFDGRRIMFLCTRPPEGKEPLPGWGHQNIWVSKRTADGDWGKAFELGPPVNSENAEYFPSLTQDGTLYFTRQTPKSGSKIYRSRWINGRYEGPEKVPDPVNSQGNLYNACISRDESLLIACIAGRDDATSPGTANYYVFFRDQDDVWSQGINLGVQINPPGINAVSPSLSPDGKYFFFASTISNLADVASSQTLRLQTLLEHHKNPQNGGSDIYWVDARVIHKLKPGDSFPLP